MFGTVSDKKLAVLGFSFKANTNDTRNSACIKICKDLIEEGAVLSIYDPKVSKNQIEEDLESAPNDMESNLTNEGWTYSKSIESSIKDSHAIIVLTDWSEFKNLEWDLLFKTMQRPAWIFDTRYIFDVKILQKIGFNVWQIGNYSNSNF